MKSRVTRKLILALLAGLIFILIGSHGRQSIASARLAIFDATDVVHEPNTQLSDYLAHYLKSLGTIRDDSDTMLVGNLEREQDATREDTVKHEAVVDDATQLGDSQTKDRTAEPVTTSGIAKIEQYVSSILDLSDTKLSRLKCPVSTGTRYEHLRKDISQEHKVKYLIALNLHQNEQILPRLLGSIIEVVKYLGPSNCALSIIEGRSSDLTWPILSALTPSLESLGVKYFLSQSAINPLDGPMNRIEALACLRNLVLRPLTMPKSADLFTNDTVILFSNDIASCPDDLLELLHQHKYQEASMTCAMDWIHNGNAFYDVWISRTLNSGNTFFEVPQDANWVYAENLFWDDEKTRKRFEKKLPFQVYACWGGMVTIDGAPFLNHQLKFRSSEDGECFIGEPTLLAKDLWRMGQGRILTVPSVNVAYGDDEGAEVKKRRGFVEENVDMVKNAALEAEEKVEWQDKPPAMVKCAPEWQRVSWVDPI